ncbi:MAG: hypothetical protein ACKO4A_06695, partial [Gammaproteobacteria bacterium]
MSRLPSASGNPRTAAFFALFIAAGLSGCSREPAPDTAAAPPAAAAEPRPVDAARLRAADAEPGNW